MQRSLIIKGYRQLTDAISKSLSEKNITPIINVIHKVIFKIHEITAKNIINIISEKYSSDKYYKKILFLDKTSLHDGAGIGDSVFKLAALNDMGRNFPQSEIDVLTVDTRSILFSKNNYINNTYNINPNKPINTQKQLINTLKNRKYDLFVTINNSPSKYTIKRKIDGKKPFVTSTYLEKFHHNPHTNHIQLMREGLATSLGYEIDSDTHQQPSIGLSDQTLNRAENELSLIKPKKIVALSIGWKDPLKKYTQWHMVVQMLAKKFPKHYFILLGDNTGNEILGKRKTPKNVTNYCGNISLEKTLGLIVKSDFISGIDGGLLNSAIALGTRTHVIFNIITPTDIVTKQASQTIATTKDVGCVTSEKCYYHDYRFCRKSNSSTPTCLYNLPYKEIYEDIATQINGLSS